MDNAAIYYIFDRDNKSNTDADFIKNMLSILVNSRDNEFERQGLLLLSYPSVEAFTLSNFVDQSFNYKFETGDHLKQYLHECKINQSRITEDTLKHTAQELLEAMAAMRMGDLDVDAFGDCNMQIFEYEENEYNSENLYRALSLLCISLIDLGVIDISDSE